MTDWITEWLQQNKAEIDRLADTIFTHPETAGEETQSAAALENFLQKNGFSVSKNTAGLPTAFTAEKGKGRTAESGAEPGRALRSCSRKRAWLWA